MRILYTGSDLAQVHREGIFLAGPTLPSHTAHWNGYTSWRVTAIELLSKFYYNGPVFVPERMPKPTLNGKDDADAVLPDDRAAILDWEWKALERASVLAFWVPRHLEHLPGFTTNVEFGLYAQSTKVVFGCPPDTPKTTYLKIACARLGIPTADTLEGIMHLAVLGTILGIPKIPRDAFRDPESDDPFGACGP